MIKHIGLFMLKDLETGKSRDEVLKLVRSALEEVPAHLSTIVTSEAGTSNSAFQEPEGHRPPELPGMINEPPKFYDAVQIITFKNAEDARNYPFSQAHKELVEKTDRYIRTVAMIEFEY